LRDLCPRDVIQKNSARRIQTPEGFTRRAPADRAAGSLFCKILKRTPSRNRICIGHIRKRIPANGKYAGNTRELQSLSYSASYHLAFGGDMIFVISA